jgi:putative Mg2+ transporter-C (MgtC) family protein
MLGLLTAAVYCGPNVGRIASNVVIGIGFLGGEAILHSGMKIEGLTTAAHPWLVAAVGLAAEAGLCILAIVSATIAMIARVGLQYLEVC